ncbi:MAG: flagellar basal body L-ring protein FlgH, partial [Alphaproteobacteria bacterium]|nr:flagellar basal body L-ring protein FlgH [Alphaproteobacteria bacterium]
MTRYRRLSALLFAASLLGGCNTLDRLGQIGAEPPLTPVGQHIEQASRQPVTMPMPTPKAEVYQANSLWRQGARGFFKDQRARDIGDVLTVKVVIADEASLENESSRSRSNTEDMGIDGILGFGEKIQKVLPGNPNLGSLVDLDSNVSNLGKGNVTRNEEIKLNVAVVVVQRLPNGNLVIHGRQEVRVNYEVRELYVAGVVRPADITPDNMISHD